MLKFTIVLLIILFSQGCLDKGKNYEKVVKDFYFNNENEIKNIFDSLEKDSIFISLRRITVTGSSSYSFDLKNHDQGYSIYIDVDVEPSKEDSYWQRSPKRIKLRNGKALDVVLDDANISYKYFIKWIYLVRKHNIYMLDKYDDGIFRILLEPNISLLYITNINDYQLDSLEGQVFFRIQDKYYYHYNPDTHGFFY